nr:substrate-binding domain-containing protein [Maliibacterium massiliense]
MSHKKSLKLLAFVVVMTLLCAMLTACQKAGEASGSAAPSVSQTVVKGDEKVDDDVLAGLNLPEKCEFAISVKAMSNPFYVKIVDGAEAIMREGDTLTVVDAKNDSVKQVTDVEDLATRGYDAILLAPCDYQGITPALEACKSKNVPVILFDSLAFSMDLTSGSVVSDNVQAGELAAEALAKDIGEQGKVAIIESTTSPAAVDRAKGFDATIKKYPNIEIVIRENGEGQVDTAIPIMENFMQVEPELKAVFCRNDPVAQGCSSAIEAAGKTGKIKVYGVDGSDESKKLIAEGKQAGSAAQFPDRIGEQSVILAYRVVAGEELTETERNIKIPCEWIDASNVEQYI